MRPGERTAFIGPKGLKPCPLCGGPASVYEYTAGVFWTTPTVEATRIGCDRCGLEIRGDGAAKAWNTRAERTCKPANVAGYAWDDFECSECGWVTWSFLMEHEGCGTVCQPRFCPNCGAKVVEE